MDAFDHELGWRRDTSLDGLLDPPGVIDTDISSL